MFQWFRRLMYLGMPDKVAPMTEQPVVESLFYCRPCHGLHSLLYAGEIDASISLMGKVYPAGYCITCWPKYHAITNEEALNLQIALDQSTDPLLRDLFEEPKAPA